MSLSNLISATYFRVSATAPATTRLTPGDVVADVPNFGLIALRGGNQLAPVAGNDAATLLAALVADGHLIELTDAA